MPDVYALDAQPSPSGLPCIRCVAPTATTWRGPGSRWCSKYNCKTAAAAARAALGEDEKQKKIGEQAEALRSQDVAAMQRELEELRRREGGAATKEPQPPKPKTADGAMRKRKPLGGVDGIAPQRPRPTKKGGWHSLYETLYVAPDGVVHAAKPPSDV